MNSITLANFVNALFWVYIILIFARILVSWTGMPSERTIVQIYRFIYEVTEPYLGLFRRIVPVAGGIDFSPTVGLIVLYIVRSYLVRYIAHGSF